MHALFKGEVERKMTSGSTGFLRCASRSLNSPTVMLFGLPGEQRLPKSLPQLSIRHTAAQTRIVSTAETQTKRNYHGTSNR
jgi:hypothetical protein